MSEHKKPFTDHVIQKQRGTPPTKLAWTVAGVLGAAAITFVFLWADAVGKLRGFESLPSKLNDANAKLAAANDLDDKEKNQITDLQSQIADLQKEKADAAQMSKALEDEMRSNLQSQDVTISNLQGQLTVNILDRVLFDSGEAMLKPDGESVLRKVAAILAEHPKLKIHVIGHTDNVPVRNRFASNWELSSARALAAVHFLTETAAVDPRRVGAVGYGEFRPIADNATPAGRAQNRRIAIVILPAEIASADIPPPIKPAAPPETPPTDVVPPAAP
jgi:chemotaxis protein MotB